MTHHLRTYKIGCHTGKGGGGCVKTTETDEPKRKKKKVTKEK